MRRFVPRQESAALMLANLSWLAQGQEWRERVAQSRDAGRSAALAGFA